MSKSVELILFCCHLAKISVNASFCSFEFSVDYKKIHESFYSVSLAGVAIPVRLLDQGGVGLVWCGGIRRV